jgi:hypothetical protein
MAVRPFEQSGCIVFEPTAMGRKVAKPLTLAALMAAAKVGP